MQSEGHTKPLVVAADTYRAAGIDQMVAWAERAGVEHFEGTSGADPASVVFDGVQVAAKRGHDVVIADTAGRMQTSATSSRSSPRSAARDGQGAERSAVRVVARARRGAWHYQRCPGARLNKAIPVTGLVLTKLDSTAKGGAVIEIESELDIPVKLAGVGEGVDDLEPFDAAAFVRAIFES